jgi:hypothetical protein
VSLIRTVLGDIPAAQLGVSYARGSSGPLVNRSSHRAERIFGTNPAHANAFAKATRRHEPTTTHEKSLENRRNQL